MNEWMNEWMSKQVNEWKILQQSISPIYSIYVGLCWHWVREVPGSIPISCSYTHILFLHSYIVLTLISRSYTHISFFYSYLILTLISRSYTHISFFHSYLVLPLISRSSTHISFFHSYLVLTLIVDSYTHNLFSVSQYKLKAVTSSQGVPVSTSVTPPLLKRLAFHWQYLNSQ